MGFEMERRWPAGGGRTRTAIDLSYYASSQASVHHFRSSALPWCRYKVMVEYDNLKFCELRMINHSKKDWELVDVKVDGVECVF